MHKNATKPAFSVKKYRTLTIFLLTLESLPGFNHVVCVAFMSTVKTEEFLLLCALHCISNHRLS